MLTVTFDTNCLIDVDDDRPAKGHVLRIVDAANAGLIDVAMVASSASEKQPGGAPRLTEIGPFIDRMKSLGFGKIDLLKPLGKYGLSFYNFSLYGGGALSEREQEIFSLLFPDTPYKWSEFAAANGLQTEDLEAAAAWKWKNKLCDAQAFWAHDHHKRDIFVTSDANFAQKLLKSPAFEKAGIKTPSETVELLPTVK